MYVDMTECGRLSAYFEPELHMLFSDRILGDRERRVQSESRKDRMEMEEYMQ